MGVNMKKETEQFAMQYLNISLKYYDKKSISCKKWYAVLILVEIILSAFIPFTTLFFNSFPITKYIVALIGSIITIASSSRAKFSFQEQWVQYRTATEILKYHMMLYKTSSPPYENRDKDELLINKVNEICMDENKSWRNMKLNMLKKTDT